MLLHHLRCVAAFECALGTLSVRHRGDRLRSFLGVIARVYTGSDLALLQTSLLSSYSLACVGNRVHFLSEDFLQRGRSGQAKLLLLQLSVIAELTHLGLDVPEVLILGVVSVHSSIALQHLHRIGLMLRTVCINLAQVQVSPACVRHAWEKSRIEGIITAIPALVAAVRVKERVGCIRLLVHSLEVMLFETCIAAHSVSGCHTVCLLAVQRASIRPVMARVLALIQEVVCHCLIHDASSDEVAALRHERVVVFVMGVDPHHFSVSDQLLRPRNVDIV